MLFVCVGNSCRSIMAEAMARSLGGPRVMAASAGLAPAGFVAEPTMRVLAERGHDVAGLYSKGLDAVAGRTFDVVVSLLGERGLQVLPSRLGHHREAWDVVDPFGEDEALYRRVAGELEARVRRLLDDEVGRELPGS